MTQSLLESLGFLMPPVKIRAGYTCLTLVYENGDVVRVPCPYSTVLPLDKDAFRRSARAFDKPLYMVWCTVK